MNRLGDGKAQSQLPSRRPFIATRQERQEKTLKKNASIRLGPAATRAGALGRTIWVSCVGENMTGLLMCWVAGRWDW